MTSAANPPFARQLLLAIERAGVLAWPAVETHGLDGWLWRFAAGEFGDRQ